MCNNINNLLVCNFFLIWTYFIIQLFTHIEEAAGNAYVSLLHMPLAVYITIQIS